MRVPFPETVEFGDYEIGMALRADVMSRHKEQPGMIWIGFRPWGEAIEMTAQFERDYDEDTTLARASNILTRPKTLQRGPKVEVRQ